MTLYLGARHYFGWYVVNVLQLDPAIVAEQLGHKDGGQFVEHVHAIRTSVCGARRSATRTRPARRFGRSERSERTTWRESHTAHATPE
jgi:hypothetical protein